MPSEIAKKALDRGLITQKQYDKLPPKLLDAIAKKKLKDKTINPKKNGKNQKAGGRNGKKSGK